MSSKFFVRIHPVLMMLWAKMSQLPMSPIAHVPHWPCDLLTMWPIPHIPHTPCVPIAHVAHTPVPHTPCGPHCPYAPYLCTPYPLYHFAPVGLIAHVPHTPCTPLPPVSTLPIGPIVHVAHTPCTPLPPLPIWPITQWGAEVMGNGTHGAIVYRGYGIQGYGAHGQ